MRSKASFTIVMELWNAYVLAEFAACATNKTFSATWKCRTQRHAMNSCMVSHATPEEQDAAREEWFAGLDSRAALREAKDKKKQEQEKFHREWWGLPQKEQEGDGFGRKHQ